MSIIAYPLEATEYSAEDVQSYLSTRTSGVYSEEITLTPEGMTATISPFIAWFNYAKFKGCSVAVTEPETLTFEPAHAVLDRIDRVVLRLDLTVNKAYLQVLKGMEAGEFYPPYISRTEEIYDVSPFYVRIRAGATEITPADITSTILDESVCGIMRDGVTGIPTAQLQSQAEELIEQLKTAISEVEADSAFMMGDVYDPKKKTKPVAFADEIFTSIYPVGSIITIRGNGTDPNKLGGVWEPLPTANHIPLKEYFEIKEANTAYTKVIDVLQYFISRDDYNIVALPKSSTPSGVSVSFGNITTKSTNYGEIIETIEIIVSRTTAVNTWVHLLFSGTCVTGFDFRFSTDTYNEIGMNFVRVE
jgi:hypothetical protein